MASAPANATGISYISDTGKTDYEGRMRRLDRKRARHTYHRWGLTKRDTIPRGRDDDDDENDAYVGSRLLFMDCLMLLSLRRDRGKLLETFFFLSSRLSMVIVLCSLSS
jgi:hypothetical protein